MKLLRPEIVTDPDLALRFRREAHAAAVLHHPAVVGYLGSGTDGGQPFLVMELVDGDDLATRIRNAAPLPPRTAVRIAADVASGLAVAHARGIVHRDVKPGNIILDAADRARITDFGVARIAAESEATIPGTTLGSVHYFSPEQARGLPTTPASDVYSLGLVLYEMLTGTRPFTGETTAAIALARVGAPAPHPRAIDPTLPPTSMRSSPGPSTRIPPPATRTVAHSPMPWSEPLRRPLHRRRPRSTRRARRPFRRPGADSAVGRSDRASSRRCSASPPPLRCCSAASLRSPRSAAAQGSRASWPRRRTIRAPRRWPPRPAKRPDRRLGSAGDAGPDADPTAQPAPAGPGDLCEPDPGATCALAAGTYSPSQFEPELSIDLDDGWETFRAGDRLVVLARRGLSRSPVRCRPPSTATKRTRSARMPTTCSTPSGRTRPWWSSTSDAPGSTGTGQSSSMSCRTATGRRSSAAGTTCSTSSPRPSPRVRLRGSRRASHPRPGGRQRRRSRQLPRRCGRSTFEPQRRLIGRSAAETIHLT